MSEARVSPADLVWSQIRYEDKLFWRSPVAAFFVLVMPLIFLVVFVLIFGNDQVSSLGVTLAQFYAPSLAVFGAVSATYTNLAMGTTLAWEEGILKRVRGTPLHTRPSMNAQLRRWIVVGPQAWRAAR